MQTQIDMRMQILFLATVLDYSHIFHLMVNGSNLINSWCSDVASCFAGFGLQICLMLLLVPLPAFVRNLLCTFVGLLCSFNQKMQMVLTFLNNIFNYCRIQFAAWFLRGRILILSVCMIHVLLRKQKPKHYSYDWDQVIKIGRLENWNKWKKHHVH